MLDLWGNIGFLLFTFSTLVFTILYLASSRFLTNAAGSLIAIFLVGIDVLCLYLSLRVWGIAVPGVEWVRLIIFWILGLAMFISVIGFIQVQFGKGRRERVGRRSADVNPRENSN